jgi:hypothetical protein
VLCASFSRLGEPPFCVAGELLERRTTNTGASPRRSQKDRSSAGSGPTTRAQRPKHPLPRVGTTTIAAGTVARIIQAPAATAGFNASALGGHSLKRGGLSTGMGCGHEVKNDV